MKAKKYVLVIYGNPFDLFEINNLLGLDTATALKEKYVKGKTLKMRLLVYELNESNLNTMKDKIDTLYNQLKESKRLVSQNQLGQLKLNKTICYTCCLDDEDEYTSFTIKKLKELL